MLTPWQANNWEAPTRAEANRDEVDTLPAHLTAEEQAQVDAAFAAYSRLLDRIGEPNARP